MNEMKIKGVGSLCRSSRSPRGHTTLAESSPWQHERSGVSVANAIHFIVAVPARFNLGF